MALIYPLCSSSKGNATYVGDRQHGILIDAGIGIRDFASILGLGGIAPEAVQAIFITHEHTDHIKGLKRITQKYSIPVYGSRLTLEYLLEKDFVSEDCKLFEIRNKPAHAADMEITCFSTLHDALDSQCYTIRTSDDKKVTVCTDTGCISDEMEYHMDGSDFLLLESNYDIQFLQKGKYPYFLKRRISSDKGHLSNEDCSDGVLHFAKNGTKHFMLGHLSQENNTPETALTHTVSKLTLSGVKINEDYTIGVAPVKSHGKVIEV